jgi:hypothetical protein
MPKKAPNIRIKISLMIATLFITAVIGNIADAQEAPTIFGDITIDHKFSPDPLTKRGMSGGSVPASEIGGKETSSGPCAGFVDKEPDHTLQLISKFDYLKLQIESPQDTTVMIKGPGGVWCNDDFDGKNPGIVGEWLKGTYQIWVGSYKKGTYLPYTLKITEVK